MVYCILYCYARRFFALKGRFSAKIGLISKIFGSSNDRELKKLYPLVDAIEALEPQYKALSDEALAAKTPEFKQRYANGETLDDLLVEAFATVREASRRILGKRQYRVQLLGGIVLHQGRIAEMKTGEGKTFIAPLAAYLNALAGNGVHVITVNDYLAKYQGEMLEKLYRFLGMTVGLVIHEIEPADRKPSYEADITYGTNNEFGFDYLRDNMAVYKDAMVQRGHAFAIVDEVDSILIDEARTPLIISGAGDKSTDLYAQADAFARRLTAARIKEQDTKTFDTENLGGDYIVDEKARTVTLTEQGTAKAERHFGVENLADPENATLAHHINQAIRAHGIMRLDVDYVVKDGEVIIIDEFTGRMMYGRRYSDGLHQAIEAKEGVKVERESRTLATITFQNYFRMYSKLSGMTGTAMTEKEEFAEIYRLDVVEIPTNKPMIRTDLPDVIYKTEKGKLRAIVEQIKECHAKGQPVLVGTISIEKSEQLSAMIKREGIKHNVLNAKFHDKEADIVAQAGKFGAVTIATNMAGRGTDIILGGNAEYMARHELRKLGYSDEAVAEADGHGAAANDEIVEARAKFVELVERFEDEIRDEAEKVRDAGGLFIVGTERHESRRIDNQLRGRAGRQGDPGASRFYISLEDDLMRLFGSDRFSGMLNTVGMSDDAPLDQKILSTAIEQAQKNIESRHYQTRKNVLEYDDVMNTQREMIYKQRREVLDGQDFKASIQSMLTSSIANTVSAIVGSENAPEPYMIEQLAAKYEGLFLEKGELVFDEKMSAASLTEFLTARALEAYEAKEAELTPERMREIERILLLRVVDNKWMDHIDAMQELRQGIGLRAYAQTDPKTEYKREGMDMFDEMIDAIREETARLMLTVRLAGQQPQRTQVARPTAAVHQNFSALTQAAKKAQQNASNAGHTPARTPVRAQPKPKPNDPCPCGSGLKYKRCHGRYPDGAPGAQKNG